MGDAEKNLEIVAQNERFNEWMFNEIKPFVKGDVLEVGSGIGTISKRLVRDFDNVCLTDISDEYISNLKKFRKAKVTKLNLEKLSDFKKFKEESFDSIVCLNVLEHVKDDLFSVKQMKKLLKKNGKMVILVPAHKFLYNELDKAVLHHKRYDKKDILELGKKSGLKIDKLFYFNAFSILGWFVNGTLLKKRNVSEGAMGLLDKLVPIFRFIEKCILFRRIGLSLIVVFRK